MEDEQRDPGRAASVVAAIDRQAPIPGRGGRSRIRCHLTPAACHLTLVPGMRVYGSITTVDFPGISI